MSNRGPTIPPGAGGPSTSAALSAHHVVAAPQLPLGSEPPGGAHAPPAVALDLPVEDDIDERRLFGTRTVWRGRTRVEVSDVHRTIIDMLDDPALGAGIQHVSDCLSRYLASSDSDLGRLLVYASQLGNGAVYKRLGYLAERLSADNSLLETCRERLTAGDAKLDPSLDCQRLVTRWKLRVPNSWTRGVAA